MKKLKVIIPVLVIIAIISGVAVFVLSQNKVAISGRSKAERGFSKSFNSFSEEELGENYKIFKNLSSKPYESNVKFNVDLDIDDLEELLGDDDVADLVTKLLDELANSSIEVKTGMDMSKKEILAGLTVNSENTIGEISGETVITEDKIAFRSKDINEKFLSLSKDDAKEYKSIEDIFNVIEEFFNKDISNFEFTDEEIEHFKEKYGNVLDETVTDDMITNEKGSFSDKSCTVTTVKFSPEKFRELLLNYVNTYKDDTEGKEIIKNKLYLIYGEEIADQMLDQVDEMIDELPDEIETIEASIDFVTYGNMLNVFGNEYRITIDEETLKLVETFENEETKYVVSFDDEDLLTASVKDVKNEKVIEAKIEIAGYKVNVSATISEEKANFIVEADNVVTIELNTDIDTKTNTEKALEQDVNMTINVDIPSEKISGSAKIAMSEKINIVDSLDLPDTSDSVSIMDEDKLEKYATDSEENLKKLGEKLEKSDVIKSIMDVYSDYVGATQSILDETNEALENENELLDQQTEEINKMLFKTDIQQWYSSIKNDDSEKSEAIEENMITSDDFSDDVEITTYISWEEDEKTDEGYLGVEVTDSDDNSYEFYIDLSKDKVYDEDDVPFDTEEVEWNEY